MLSQVDQVGQDQAGIDVSDGGYAFLFQSTCQSLSLSIRDMTFENFRSIEVTAETLGVIPANRTVTKCFGEALKQRIHP